MIPTPFPVPCLHRDGTTSWGVVAKNHLINRGQWPVAGWDVNGHELPGAAAAADRAEFARKSSLGV